MYETSYFLDIETAPAVQFFKDLPERAQDLFNKKFKKQFDELFFEGTLEDKYQKVWKDNASFHAEFNQIVCISVGAFRKDLSFKQENIIGDEVTILTRLKAILELGKPWVIVAHNGKSFDFPIIGRKYLLHGMPLPAIFDVMDKKPWESQWRDTMEMYAFGEWNKKTSLDLIAYSFGIPSPKQNMDGSQVAEYFFAGKIKEIASYCGLDVMVLAAVYMAMKGLDESALPQFNMLLDQIKSQNQTTLAL